MHATADDPVLTAISEGVGGRMGSRVTRHPWWTPVRILLALTAVTFSLGMVQKGNCYDDTWNDSKARFTHMCYSDLPYLYTGRRFVTLDWPYDGDAQAIANKEVMEYPVGISYWAYASAWVTQLATGSPDVDARRAADPAVVNASPQVQQEIRGFVVVNAIGFAIITLLTTWLLAGTNRQGGRGTRHIGGRLGPRGATRRFGRFRPWDALAFVISPALLLNGLVNWDLLAVVTVAGAMWAWSRDRPILTGVLIGLGTATKLYPLFLLGGLLIICLRDKRMRDFTVATIGAAFAWVIANAPAYISSATDWKVFWSFNSDRPADLGSIWLVASQAFDHTFAPSTINHVSLAFFGLWCIAVLAVGLKAPSTPRLAQLGFLLVAGFLLVNKVYSPQYTLWLLPLAVLARPRWRDQIIWQSTEIIYFAFVWWYLDGDLAPGGGGDAGFYWLAIVLRLLGELYLIGLVTRDIVRPHLDPVGREDELDELVVPGGPQDRAPSDGVPVPG